MENMQINFVNVFMCETHCHNDLLCKNNLRNTALLDGHPLVVFTNLVFAFKYVQLRAVGLLKCKNCC